MHLEFSELLLNYVEEDQKDLIGLGEKLGPITLFNKKISTIKPIAKKCQSRAIKVMSYIKKNNINPSITNYGKEAAEGVILIFLHSYAELMGEFCDFYDSLIKKNPKDYPLEYYAVLKDRIEVVNNRKQVLGTTKYNDLDSNEYYVPIIDIENIDARRAEYGLIPFDKRTDIIQKILTDEDFLLNFAFMDKKIDD